MRVKKPNFVFIYDFDSLVAIKIISNIKVVEEEIIWLT